MDDVAGVEPGHRVLGRYEIVRHIASGGMGSVFEARDRTLDQAVALKRVRFANLSGPDAEQTRLRTLREARYAAQLRGHPHVVSIYDVQEDDGDVWLVLEYLPSRSLADITENGECIPVAEAARVGAAVADALAAAHARGIVHRDVKPGNVLISNADGAVKLTDFGISHGVGEHPLTTTDAVSGTPAYMSGEVARGDGESPASDVFSLGATLYRVVEGRSPYGEGAGNSLQLLYRAANGTVAPPQRTGSFTPLLMQLLAPDPAARPDAADAARRLDDAARRQHQPTVAPAPGPPPFPPPPPTGPPAAPGARPRRRGRAAAIGAALVLVAALVVGGAAYLSRPDPTAIPELPASVPPRVLTGNVKDADPCALLDPAVMDRFGSPARTGPGSAVGRCRVTNSTPGGDVITDVSFTNDTVTASSALGTAPPQDLGGVKIFRPGVRSGACENDLVLSDGTIVFIQTSARRGNPPNLCEIGEAAVHVAVRRLADDGIGLRPGWQSGIGLARQDACTLAGSAALAQIPGLDATERRSSSGGGFCDIGPQQAGRPGVQVILGLESTGDISGYGTAAAPVDGRAVYTDATAPFGPNRTACTAYLLHKPSYDGGASGPAEYIGVAVESDQPLDQLCRQATTLAAAAERNATS